ncbi:MAG: DNA polymerase III subunit alpha, partial [Flavobacteriales bacterium]
STIRGKEITLGFQHIKSLEHNAVDEVLKARRDGLFLSLDDFLDRVKISLEQCVLLARINAFRFTGLTKKDVLWKLHFRLGKSKTTNPDVELFPIEKKDFILPPLEHHWLEDAYDELELIGFPLCNPFDIIAEDLKGQNIVLAKDYPDFIGREITTVGYLTTLKPTRTSKGDSMYFGTFLDVAGHFIDTVHFPPVAKAFPVSGWGLFLIKGKVCEEFDALSIEVSNVRKLKLLSDPRLDDTPSHPALNRKNNTTDRWVTRYLDGSGA